MRFESPLIILLAAASPALALPDLTPEIYDVHFVTDATVDPGDVVEGCAGAETGRTLLRFGTKVTNVGPDDLVIGNPGCPDCTTHPNADCTNPLFVCSPGLQVSHFRTAARFELLDLDGNVVLAGGKRGYCFNDDTCLDGKTPVFTSCDYQGLTSGCIDDYESFLDCQYLDVTDVPDVMRRALRLRVTINTDGLLPESSADNDVAQVDLPGCGDGTVHAGDDCDPSEGPCCDASCHFRPAGTMCGGAADACATDQVCDGASAACPPAGTPQDGCPIYGTCYPPGSPDPADSCQVCNPARDREHWSLVDGPDTQGIGCQVTRVDAAVQALACRPRVMRATGAAVDRVQRLLAHGAAESTATSKPGKRLMRAAQQLARRLGRAGRQGCDVAAAANEVQTLVAQLAARH
jgi:lysyl oxidase